MWVWFFWEWVLGWKEKAGKWGLQMGVNVWVVLVLVCFLYCCDGRVVDTGVAIGVDH